MAGQVPMQRLDGGIRSESRVPHAGKMPARLNVGAKGWRRPSAALSLGQRSLGPLTAAGVAGLRGIFRDRDGVLHTAFFANASVEALRWGNDPLYTFGSDR